MTQIQFLLLAAIPILFAITFHEVAHGFVAKLRGDNTAYMMGRLSLNPIKHIDLIGTIIVPAVLFLMGGFLFGWAKPVPVNEGHLKKPRFDSAIVALAGPIANFIMALFWALVARVAFSLVARMPEASEIFTYMGYIGVQINLVLMILNLIPIPPLDGSRIVSAFLPLHSAIKYNRLERYGFFILLALIIIPIGGKPILWYIMGPFISLFNVMIFSLFGLPHLG
ncbi:site-2 protease family protein [Thiotrichales bacterium 19S3-7]|nr:site-2 protease family protein [Thiotrichales bacterium 19S3-7]MCF6801566.1 site-2 protease family protein [Thiotrichales bacterium 19S3-11]